MSDLSRRTLFVGSGAAATTCDMPAFAQAAVMPPVRMVRANGIDLAVHEAGSGPPVVLLHGFPGLAFTWRHQLARIVFHGKRGELRQRYREGQEGQFGALGWW